MAQVCAICREIIMSTTNYDSRTADKFVVRLPEGLRSGIEAAANADDRSMNSVFIRAVRQYLDGQNRQSLLLDALTSSKVKHAVADPLNLAPRAAKFNGAPPEALKPQIDTRDLFIRLNPVAAGVEELEKGRGGFVDHRTHAEYLIFLAGYRAAQESQQ